MASSVPSAPKRREIELDFVRGLAILLVLDFHSPRSMLLVPFEWLGFQNFGWSGVDIFFVLSGFLVGGLLIKEWTVRGNIDTKRFLIRRGLKIWPQYYFYLILMMVTEHRGFHELWGNLLNIQNYVGGVAHTWTLAVEEHAYLLLAVALPFAARLRMRMRTVFLVLTIVTVAVICWQFFLSSRGVDVFIRTDTRIDGIFMGVMLAILYHHSPKIFQRIRGWTWLWIAVIALTIVDFRIESTTWWEHNLNFILADLMGVAVLMLLYRHRDDGRNRSVFYRVVAWIGLYSYGIYLWHVSVIRPCLMLLDHMRLGLDDVLLGLAPMTAGILLGVFTTKLIEFPMLAIRDRLFPRKVDSAVGIPAEIEQAQDVHTRPESVSI